MMLGAESTKPDTPQVRRKPLQISSHPEVDGELHDDEGLHPSEAAIDSVAPEEITDSQQRKPIVSINGEDVEEDEVNRRRAA